MTRKETLEKKITELLEKQKAYDILVKENNRLRRKLKEKK